MKSKTAENFTEQGIERMKDALLYLKWAAQHGDEQQIAMIEAIKEDLEIVERNARRRMLFVQADPKPLKATVK